MPASDVRQMLLDSAAEVLETMFFTTLASDAAPQDSAGPWICARLSFRGNPSGSFGVGVPLETGRRIGASFLGLEESITESEAGEVVCELANMLCGSVLSRLGTAARFELSHPQLEPPETGCPKGHTTSRLLGLDEGPLAVWLELEEPR